MALIVADDGDGDVAAVLPGVDDHTFHHRLGGRGNRAAESVSVLRAGLDSLSKKCCGESHACQKQSLAGAHFALPADTVVVSSAVSRFLPCVATLCAPCGGGRRLHLKDHRPEQRK